MIVISDPRILIRGDQATGRSETCAIDLALCNPRRAYAGGRRRTAVPGVCSQRRLCARSGDPIMTSCFDDVRATRSRGACRTHVRACPQANRCARLVVTVGLALIASVCVGSPRGADEIFVDGFERVVCDPGLPSDSGNALQYAAAMDLCRTTTEQSVDWGVIDASLTLSSGTGTAAPASHAIRSTFGPGNSPRAGAAMVVLSTGAAAVPGQTNPPFVAFQPGLDTGTQSAAPADWLAANGGIFPNAPGCPAASSSTAYNPVMLTLRIRVPSAVHSFRLNASFLSAEYPEYVCSAFNDLFVVLLDSGFTGAPANPADKNIASYATSGNVYPVGTNLAFGNTGLFTQCVNGSTGCAAGAIAGTTNTCASTSGLIGTSMDTPDPGMCDTNSLTGGGTDWLVLRGNVVPGEIMQLRFALWDTADGQYDSVVLLDNFEWSTDVVTPGASRD